MRNRFATLALSLLALPTLVAADESMRCGKWIVTSEATLDELLSKCGAPATKDVSIRDIYAQGPLPGRSRKVGVSTIERWTYDRGSRAFRMIVTVVDGKITQIERAE